MMYLVLLVLVVGLVAALLWQLRGQLTDVHMAARTGRVESLTSILRDRPDLLYSRNALGETPLHQAASYGELRALQLIVQLGGDVDVETPEGLTPLHLAAAAGKTDVVQYLLKLGAAPEHTAKTGITPLMAALMRDHTEVANLLRQMGAREPTGAPLTEKLARDPQLLAARQRAAESQAELLKLFKAYPRTTLVKVAYTTDTGYREWIWCELRQVTGDQMQVRVRTFPVSQRSQMETMQTLPMSALEDWQVELPDGRVRGGFSFGAMFDRQRQQYGELPQALKEQVARYVDLPQHQRV